MKASRSKKVLIVDDSALIRNRLVELLSKLKTVEIVGHAENGLQALEAIRTLKPDVITLDIRMPIMNGIQVLKAIKAERFNCIVIVLTGMAEETFRRGCLELGARYCFDKSAEFEKVKKVVGAI